MESSVIKYRGFFNKKFTVIHKFKKILEIYKKNIAEQNKIWYNDNMILWHGCAYCFLV